MADLMAAWKLTDTPLIAQANAGKPEIVDGRVVYSQAEDEYLAEIPRSSSKTGPGSSGDAAERRRPSSAAWPSSSGRFEGLQAFSGHPKKGM